MISSRRFVNVVASICLLIYSIFISSQNCLKYPFTIRQLSTTYVIENSTKNAIYSQNIKMHNFLTEKKQIFKHPKKYSTTKNLAYIYNLHILSCNRNISFEDWQKLTGIADTDEIDKFTGVGSADAKALILPLG